MDTSYEEVQFNFIRHVEQYVGTDHIAEPTEVSLIQEIVTGTLSTHEEAAARYFDGDEQLLKDTLETIQQGYTQILLDTNVYHNDAQRYASYVRTSWSLISKMLNLGHRKGAIAIAEDTFITAVTCHEFNVASEVASSLAYHAGQFQGDEEAYQMWFENYENYADQHYMMQDSKLKYAKFLLLSKQYKHNDDELRTQLAELIKQLAGFEHHAESYVYWHCYYKAKIFLHDIEGQFEELLSVAQKGYEYFATLPLNHEAAKSAMLGSVVHALNLLHRYDEAADYGLLDADHQNVNDSVLALRLVTTYLNRNDVAQALKFLSYIDPATSAGRKIDLYTSYCTGEYAGQRNDDVSMTAAYLIADLYCDLRAGKTDRYTHDYLLKFILTNDLLDTREGLFIEVLSMLRFRHSEQEVFSSIHDLIEVMRFAPLQSTEAEVLQFETILDQLM